MGYKAKSKNEQTKMRPWIQMKEWWVSEGKWVWGRIRQVKGVKFMVIEGDQTSEGEDTIEYADVTS